MSPLHRVGRHMLEFPSTQSQLPHRQPLIKSQIPLAVRICLVQYVSDRGRRLRGMALVKYCRLVLFKFGIAGESGQTLMDFTHYSVTSLVAFTVNTQVVLSAELFAVDVTIGATGNVMDGLCGDGIFVQVVRVVSLVSDARDELESLDFLVGDL
jgi:hypothetical protein